MNPDCPQGNGGTTNEPETIREFKISMSISDQTGTIPSCQLTDDAARTMIDSNASSHTETIKLLDWKDFYVFCLNRGVRLQRVWL